MIDGVRVIDFHGHVGRWDRYGMVDEPARVLHAMDSAGVDRACVFNIFHPDGTTGNNLTARFVARHPDRFIGFAYVSPLMPERMLPELERAIDTLRFAAIKLYPPYTPWPLNEAPWRPIYRFADERGLAIILHTGGEPQSLPRLVGEVAGDYSPCQLRHGALRQYPCRAQPGDCRGAVQSQRLPGDVLDVSHARRDRTTGERSRRGPRPVRLRPAADGPAIPTRQDHHGQDSGRGKAPDPGRECPPLAAARLGRPGAGPGAYNYGCSFGCWQTSGHDHTAASASNAVRVAELSRDFGISEVSIRRDLEHLARGGLLQRVHGGAVALAAGSLPGHRQPCTPPSGGKAPNRSRRRSARPVR